MRIALDTNVIVSALATRGLCADLFQAVLAEHDLLVGETVLGELRRVLTRKLRLPDATIDAIEAFLQRQAIVVTAERVAATGKLEPADGTVLAEAAAGAADVLVTGDNDLLEIQDPPLTIASPRQLWELIRRAP
ncbi:MAG: putative toxin-antitoxin system toxin component, PIN family [Gemmatimonadales bacterium]